MDPVLLARIQAKKRRPPVQEDDRPLTPEEEREVDEKVAALLRRQRLLGRAMMLDKEGRSAEAEQLRAEARKRLPRKPKR